MATLVNFGENELIPEATDRKPTLLIEAVNIWSTKPTSYS